MSSSVSQSDLVPGDVLCRQIDGSPVGYHYGVYVGDGSVIDFSMEGVCKMSFGEFKKGYDVSIKRFSKTLPRDKIVGKARYFLKNPGEWGEYNLVFSNCEHFATFCATGEKRSGQVQKTVAAGAVGVGIGVAIGSVVAISRRRNAENS